ncbi:MAG TPA: ribosome-inactivating family protein [Planctomycetota bacterium]|nr:ribosome-inactivating family protein [Planctomycetota bacterium]
MPGTLVAKKLSLDLSKYPESMKGIIGNIADKDGQIHKCRNPSVKIHEIEVKGGDDKVSVYVREENLYLVAFKNANGTFCFKGDTGHAPAGATELNQSCSYTAADGIGIFRAPATENAERDGGAVISAVARVAAHSGKDLTSDEKVALGILVYAISEALRFKKVYQKFDAVCRQGKKFKFVEFKDLVTNWHNICGGEGQWLAKQSELSTKA